MEIQIELYETVNGKRPFETWLKDMKEQHTRAQVLMRLDRLKLQVILEVVKPCRKVFVSFGFIMDLGLESIMERLEAKWFYFSVVVTKILRTGTL